MFRCTLHNYRALITVLAAALTGAAIAETAHTEIVVTATRNPQTDFDLPIAIDTLSRQQIRDGQMLVNMSESLVRIPGIVAHNRQNYAQDLQISARGFGARSTFGVRGVRLYVDGIPATMPDGQGQLSHIELGSAARIEVLRGPFSALYGNSSGGVISVFSEDAAPGNNLSVDFGAGSYDTRREAIKISGAQDRFNYVTALANFHSEGYRDHSAVRKANLNSKLSVNIDDISQLKIIVNAVDMPEAQDALGLTRAQFANDPRQAGANAELFDTRKSVRQQQLGFSYQRQLSVGDTLDGTIYGGHRTTTGFQALAVAAQNSPASAGGVTDLQRQYWGSDWHWTHRGTLLNGPTTFTAGFSYDTLSELRRGYENFSGTDLGVKGELRRDENNRVYNFDQYAQWQWEPSDSWLLIAGLRNSRVPVKSRDHYVVQGNGDDSGATEYNATTPVLGVTYRLNDAIHLYADYGKGFETPTLIELAYKSTSGSNTGLNLDLNPSRSEHYETGVKTIFDLGTATKASANIAVFHVVTHDELAVAANSSGRSVYQNVGKTQRDGLEASFDSHWQNGFGLSLAYTLLRAKYVEDFTSCPGSPCTTPQTVNAGNRIPGVSLSVLFGELSWRHKPSGFSSAFELHREAKLYVNDLNSDAAPAYTVLNWRAGFSQQLQQWHLQEFIRIDNFTDRKYAGSVIVNESSARYFEPAPGRNIYAGVSAQYDW
jgi:iron complex outermembrane recepter protein